MSRRISSYLRQHHLALVAIFLALTGTVYAAGKINGKEIKRNSIPGNRLKNNSVTGTQVNSSTLGLVPNAAHAGNADQLGGAPASAFLKGPGATTFSETLNQGTTGGTIETLANGLKVTGTCTNGPANVLVDVRTISGSNTEQVSGTATNGGGVFRADQDGTNSIGTVQDTNQVDVDVIARDTTVGTFDRIDVHGAFGLPCRFWGMIIPSS
jgi:hypothetical protein